MEEKGKQDLEGDEGEAAEVSGVGEAGELKLDDGADVPEQVSDLLLGG